MNDKWKIVPRRTIYSSKFFNVKEQEITLPNKKKKIYDFVERKSTSVIFPVTDSYDLYLISEFRTLHRKYMLEAIAGHIDEGESPLETAKRELKEEAGLTGRVWKELLKVENSGSIVKSTAYLFLVKDINEGKANPAEEEEIELVKISLSEAVKKVQNGDITVSSTIVGILLIDKMRREGKL